MDVENDASRRVMRPNVMLARPSGGRAASSAGSRARAVGVDQDRHQSQSRRAMPVRYGVSLAGAKNPPSIVGKARHTRQALDQRVDSREQILGRRRETILHGHQQNGGECSGERIDSAAGDCVAVDAEAQRWLLQPWSQRFIIAIEGGFKRIEERAIVMRLHRQAWLERMVNAMSRSAVSSA